MEQKQKEVYYAWKPYLNARIQTYMANEPRVHKTVILNGKKEVKVLKNLDWAKEWSLFLEADLNRPAYEKSYDNLSEPGFYWYSLKQGENLPVKKLVIQVDSEDRPVKVEIEISQKNFLFETKKKLFMNFTGGKVQTYYIEGMQKLAWGSPTEFKLMGVLLSK